MARRLSGTDVTANCLRPGVVRTGLGQNFKLSFATRTVFSVASRLFMISPTEGARTTVYLAGSPEVDKVSSRYFAIRQPSRFAPFDEDDEAAEKLLTASEKLFGLGGR